MLTPSNPGKHTSLIDFHWFPMIFIDFLRCSLIFFYVDVLYTMQHDVRTQWNKSWFSHRVNQQWLYWCSHHCYHRTCTDRIKIGKILQICFGLRSSCLNSNRLQSFLISVGWRFARQMRGHMRAACAIQQVEVWWCAWWPQRKLCKNICWHPGSVSSPKESQSEIWKEKR